MSSLEAAITLEDVFTVVQAKRVPLAPELAGYLTLEIADGTDAGSGDVDPRAVFISEEGTVALVRPKRDSVTGEAEASIRRLLDRLLDASGSGTPALTAAAKRKPGSGLPALVEELEAALIPVNRAAGRRALARLAREVKRVLLGVGRNASAVPLPKAQPKAAPPSRDPAPAQVSAPASTRSPSTFDDEDVTAQRPNVLGSASLPPPPTASRPPPGPPPPPERRDPTPAPPSERRDPTPAPPSERRDPTPAPPSERRDPTPAPPSERRDPTPAPPIKPETDAGERAKGLFAADEVELLLDAFGAGTATEDKQIARDLKAIAGLDPTPPPPDAATLAELTRDLGAGASKAPEQENAEEPLDRAASATGSVEDDGDGIEALLALTAESAPLPPAAHRGPPPAEPPGARRAAAGAPLPSSPREAPPPTGPLRDARAAAPLPSLGPSGRSPDAAPAPQRERRARIEGPRAPKTGMAMLVFALIVLAGGTLAIWWFFPQVFTGKAGRSATTTSAATEATPPAPKCTMSLVLTDVPANAEILLRVGGAPAQVERMPVGARLEFVATAEGYAPRRAVVPADAVWDDTADGKQRIDVPIQLEPTSAKPGMTDPWPSAEPGTQVGGSGPPGTVSIISNVRGADVWLLAGVGPEARIDHLRCDEEIDVLFAGPKALRKRLRVSEQEIGAAPADADGAKVIEVSAK